MKQLAMKLQKQFAIWNAVLKTDSNIGPTLLRLTVGLVMFPHGAQKVLGWFGGAGFAATMTVFTDVMGIPAIFAFMAIMTEFLGSLALIAGAMTRIWALGFSILMTVAIFMNHIQYGFFMNWLGQKAGEGFEFHLLVIGMSIALMVLGGGKWSVDNQVTQKIKTTK